MSKNSLNWTGERYLPWMEVGEIHYEHLHRYHFASIFVNNNTVLDLACGEGYGSAFMARTAKNVVGIDIDKETIEHAKNKYQQKNLQFLQGPITKVPFNTDNYFDVITCFEAIEHIIEQEDLMKETKRLLKKDGILIMSTPNPQSFTDDERSQFHKKELSFEQFSELIKNHFKNVEFFGQNIIVGSNIWKIDGSNNIKEFLIKKNNEYTLSEQKNKNLKFFVVIASDKKINSANLYDSYLSDLDNLLLTRKNEYAQSILDAIKEKEKEIFNLENIIKTKDTKVTEINSNIKELSAEIERLENEILELNKIIKTKDNQLSKIDSSIIKINYQIENQEAEIFSLEREKNELLTKLENMKNEAKNILEYIKNKDAEIKELNMFIEKKQDELINTKDELANIQKSFIYNSMKNIARKIDTVFPNESRRGNLKRIVGLSINTISNEGMMRFLSLAKRQIKRREFYVPPTDILTEDNEKSLMLQVKFNQKNRLKIKPHEKNEIIKDEIVIPKEDQYFLDD